MSGGRSSGAQQGVCWHLRPAFTGVLPGSTVQFGEQGRGEEGVHAILGAWPSLTGIKVRRVSRTGHPPINTFLGTRHVASECPRKVGPVPDAGGQHEGAGEPHDGRGDRQHGADDLQRGHVQQRAQA